MHDDEKIDKFVKQVMTRFDKVDKTLSQMIRLKNCMDDDKLLDNQDVCLLLGVTKRTLARYRKLKLLKYHSGDKKVYYYYSNVMKFLKQKDESL